jgi:lipopolysaccharide export system protein LptC
VSRGGSDFALTATRARPDADDPRRMTADEVRVEVGDAARGSVTMRAATARLDTAARSLTLEGDVAVESSTGYSLSAPRMAGTLGALDIRAEGGVAGTGPLGRLNAAELRLTEEGGAQRLLFTGGVELLYLPRYD